MASLPDIGREPDYGLNASPTFRIRRAQFGDGYEQRAPDGLNHVRRSWSVTWSVISEDEKTALMSFFAQMAGVYSFYWVIPDTFENVRVTCEDPSATFDSFSNHTVTATFKEVLDIV